MTAKPEAAEHEPRFPWGFLIFALSPFVVPAVIFAVLSLCEVRGESGFGWVMLAGSLFVVLAVGVIAVGLASVVWGDSRTHPAVRWLLWLPAALFFLGVLIRLFEAL